MPPKKSKKKGLKQKQKQMVRTSVRVNVQSAGGSGAGGSIPPTAGVPSAFQEARLASLIEQIGRRVPVQQPVYVPSGMPIEELVPVARFQPANDAATLNAVFMGESDLLKPLSNTGPVEKKARKPREKVPISSRMSAEEAGYMSFPSSEGERATTAEIRRQEKSAKMMFKSYGDGNPYTSE
jgi:hypothetical protein